MSDRLAFSSSVLRGSVLRGFVPEPYRHRRVLLGAAIRSRIAFRDSRTLRGVR